MQEPCKNQARTEKNMYKIRRHKLWKKKYLIRGVGEGGGVLAKAKKNCECWYNFHILPPPWDVDHSILNCFQSKKIAKCKEDFVRGRWALLDLKTIEQ